MPVISNGTRQVFSIPGIEHRTLAGHADGLEHVEVWMQTLDPAAETPVHYHECEEVVVVLRGSGSALVGDETVAFEEGSTLVIPPKLVHQLVNNGDSEMLLIATLSETPGRVFTPDGQLMQLPWS